MPMTSESKGYGHKSRQPAGRCIVEGRSNNYKLTIWAQDLKPETRYSIFLLFADDRRYAGINMGSLSIDEKGKGEVRRDFDGSIMGNFALPDIVAVAVIVKEATGVVSPLCGYKEGPVSWRHGFYEYSIKATTTPKQDDLPANAPIPTIKQEQAPEAIAQDPPPCIHEEVIEEPPQNPPTEEIAAPTQNPPAEPIPNTPNEEAPIQDQVQETIQNITIEAPPPPVPIETPPTPEPPPTPQPQTTDNPTQEAPLSINWATSLPQSEMAKAFRTALDKLHTETLQLSAKCPHKPSIVTLFETREPITPFQKQTRKTKWISFTLSDQVPPPTNKPQLFEDPFVQAALSQFQHLILGMTIDQGPRRYIIGVPGIFDQESRQKAKKLGFTQFKCTNDTYPNWGETGYWLMFTTVC